MGLSLSGILHVHLIKDSFSCQTKFVFITVQNKYAVNVEF
jgi:hypothetical protein